ncbi:MAG: hypothetical protein QOJ29_1848 [Thermoleophilaceae bacterium]|nr:hypothetical protein [Thermoleophilaceae bacterium]
MVARLVLIEEPSAVKPANTKDGGADMVLPKSGGGYQRCWQAKHYPKAIGWTKCRESLAEAVKTWKPERYTFCFPRNLTAQEQASFDKHFRGPDMGVEVDQWNGTAIQDRLTGSEKGERVARTFFEREPNDDRLYQAIAAGRKLETAEDAVDRISTVGEFLSQKDAYFAYPASTHETEGPAPPLTPGTVMSVVKIDGEVSSRVDVVPRDPEAMERYGPEFTLTATEGEAGRQAAEQLQAALREGSEVVIEEGLDMTFTQLPPGLVELEGKTLSGGRVEVGKPQRVVRRPPAWKARLIAEHQQERRTIDVLLEPLDQAPEGWDTGLSGASGGLTATVLFREGDGRGEMRWQLTHRRDDSPARDQVKALRFFEPLAVGGQMTVKDLGASGRPDLVVRAQPLALTPQSQALVAFLEDVVVIEKWASVTYALPDEISAAEARAIAQVAETIRQGGIAQNWHDITFSVTDDAVEPIRGGGVIRIERALATRVLGREVALGFTQLDIDGYRLVSATPTGSGYSEVRLEPVEGSDGRLFERLSRKPTSARKPPPRPPRRKAKRKASSGNKRRQRRR